MAMANSLCSVFSYIYLTLIGNLLITIVGSINGSNATKIVLQLIHRETIFPAALSYRPNITISDHTNHSINSSEAHHLANHLQSESDDIRAPLIPEEGRRIFWVNVSIGEPPLPQLLEMDTGSSLTWVGHHPIYDPKNSSASSILTCFSTQQCFSYYDNSHCGKGSQCTYEVQYADETWSRGILATEKFSFVTSTGGISTLPNLLFGIATATDGKCPNQFGILGLQNLNKHTLVSRVGNKYSYCIGNISDPHYPYSQLILGEGAIIQGDSTPMERNWQGYYLMTLEGISVGDKQLEIDEEDFKYNVLLDTGTTLTTLPKREFEQLKKVVMELLDGILEQIIFTRRPDILCYQGNLERDLKGFPTVTFHFAQDADLSLDAEGMFWRHSDDVFCMAVEVSKTNVHIIGIIAQQYYNFGYDLNAKEVSFQSIECEFLED